MINTNRNLVTLPEKKHRTTWNFFHSGPTLTSSDFPDDLDTTSLALWNVASIGDETKHAVMDQMLEYMDEDGLFNVSAYLFYLFLSLYLASRATSRFIPLLLLIALLQTTTHTAGPK